MYLLKGREEYKIYMYNPYVLNYKLFFTFPMCQMPERLEQVL